MQEENLEEQIKRVARSFRCEVDRIIRAAYRWRFGTNVNILHQAELAGKRFRKRGTLCANAKDALRSFLNRASFHQQRSLIAEA